VPAEPKCCPPDQIRNEPTTQDTPVPTQRHHCACCSRLGCRVSHCATDCADFGGHCTCSLEMFLSEKELAKSHRRRAGAEEDGILGFGEWGREVRFLHKGRLDGANALTVWGTHCRRYAGRSFQIPPEVRYRRGEQRQNSR